MRILCTGSRGFIGRWLVPELESEHEVLATSRLDFDVCNTKQMRRVLLDWEPEYVVHLAALTGRELVTDPVQACATNVAATGELARLCESLQIQFAYASSSEIYGPSEGLSTEAEAHLYPRNLYGLTKWQGEQISALYHSDPLILRFCMPYGPGFPGTSMYPGRGKNALINFLWAALNEQSIQVHRGAERSWVWIEDLCKAICVLVRGEYVGIYNVGRDDDLQAMGYVAYLAYHLVGTEDRSEEVDPPWSVTPIKNISTAKLQKLTAWTPGMELEDGMSQTLEWLRTIKSSPAGVNPSLRSR